MNLQEIKEAVKESPELVNEIVQFANETEKGKEVLNNFAKNHFDENVGAHVSTTYNKIDENMAKILGTSKPQNTKTVDYIVQVAEELKTLKDSNGNIDPEKFNQMKTELEEAKKKLEANGGQDGFYKNEFEKSQKDLEKLQSDWENERSDFKSTIRNSSIDNELARGLAGLKFNEAISLEAREALITGEKKKIRDNARIEDDGTIVYTDAGGNMIKNADHSRATGVQVLQKRLEALGILGVAKPKGGDGATKGKGVFVKGTKEEKASISIDGENSFKTQDDVNAKLKNALIDQGIAVGSKDYNDAIDSYYLANPELNKLPKF